jgi:putative transposase
MSQSFAALFVHLVFSTKRREPRLDDELSPRLYAYFGGILRNHDCQLVAAGGMPDHVHMLIALGRTKTISETVRVVKANSSSWMHSELRRTDIGWQDGYGAFSVSQSNLPQVEDYLAHQAEHHKRQTFQEEFLALLNRHGLSWDERYVWD